MQSSGTFSKEKVPDGVWNGDYDSPRMNEHVLRVEGLPLHF